MTKLEKDEEDAFVVEASKIGCAAIKFKHQGMRGAPDREVFCPKARVIFFEFKREGEERTHQQIQFAKSLNKLGFEVHCVYTCEEALLILKRFIGL